MLGFTITVTSDPAQVPNNPGWGGVGVQNVDPVSAIELCDDPGFPNGYIYTLEPGSWYAFANTSTVNPATGEPITQGTQSYWARTDPGVSANLWINPGGAANIGKPLAGSGALDAVASIIALNMPIVESSLDPPLGEDFQFTLPDASRVAALQMSLQTGTSSALNRYPYLYIWSSTSKSLPFKIQVSADPIPPNSFNQFFGYLGGPRPFVRGADPVQSFSIPNLLLPAGTLVQSFTRNLDASEDQWSDIGLILAP